VAIPDGDKYQNGYCYEHGCACGLRMSSIGMCKQGEFCHSNNALGWLGKILSRVPLGVGGIFLPMFCTSPDGEAKIKDFDQEVSVEEGEKALYEPEIEWAKKNSGASLTLKQYSNYKRFKNFDGPLPVASGKVRVMARHAYLGEEGKLCGRYFNVFGNEETPRRCLAGEYCGTGFGGLWLKNFTCVKLASNFLNKDLLEQGLCT